MNNRDSPTRAAFARRLRALRHALSLERGLGRDGLTQAMMAASLELKAETYRRYERAEANPTLQTLADIRRVTGVSLDVLIAGERPTSATIVSLDGMVAADFTLADRLRWTREAVLPDVAEVATIMATAVETWQRWERGQDRPPVNVMMEFAHRFGVSLDFLYSGQLTGMAPEVWAAILALHPELGEREPGQPLDPVSGSTATRRIRKARGGDRSDRPRSVSVSKPEKE